MIQLGCFFPQNLIHNEMFPSPYSLIDIHPTGPLGGPKCLPLLALVKLSFFNDCLPYCLRFEATTQIDICSQFICCRVQAHGNSESHGHLYPLRALCCSCFQGREVGHLQRHKGRGICQPTQGIGLLVLL